jgi:hypothetical protein
MLLVHLLVSFLRCVLIALAILLTMTIVSVFIESN